MQRLITFFSQPIIRKWALVAGVLAIILAHADVVALLIQNPEGPLPALTLATVLATVGAIVWYVYVLQFVANRGWRWLRVHTYSYGHIAALIVLCLYWLYLAISLASGSVTSSDLEIILLVVLIAPAVPVLWLLGYIAHVMQLDSSWQFLGHEGWALLIVLGVVLAITIVPIVWGCVFSMVGHVTDKIKARRK